MRIFVFTIMLVVCFAIAGTVHAKPLDASAAVLLSEIVAAKPGGTNLLANSLVNKLLDLAESKSQGVRLVVAYGLAYASDDRSLQVLEKLNTAT